MRKVVLCHWKGECGEVFLPLRLVILPAKDRRGADVRLELRAPPEEASAMEELRKRLSKEFSTAGFQKWNPLGPSLRQGEPPYWALVEKQEIDDGVVYLFFTIRTQGEQLKPAQWLAEVRKLLAKVGLEFDRESAS